MQKWRHTTERIGRIGYPPSWPITIKLVVTLVCAALIPMMMTAYYNLQGSLKSVTASELRNIQQMAVVTASRIDQFIRDTRLTIRYLSSEEELGHYLNEATDENYARAEAKLNSLLATSGHYALLMLMDTTGAVIAATDRQFVGKRYAFRKYFQEAAAGRDYVSDIVVGDKTLRPGLFFTAPIRRADGGTAGVVVLKVSAQAIYGLLEEVRQHPHATPLMVNAEGVILYHSEKRYLYHSLYRLAPPVLARIIKERRFMTEGISSLGFPEQFREFVEARDPGYVRFRSPLNGEKMIAGYAPVITHRWIVGVTEGESVFSEPLAALFYHVVASVIVVGLVFSVIALVFARTFVKPLRDLMRAATSVKNGDYQGGKVEVTSKDEIGQLAETFNMMLEGVQERERIKDIFGRVVSPEVREKLTSGEITLGGEYRRVAVLFSDIRGFSGLCEQMSAEDVVLLLNEYLTEMAGAVRAWGGYINNFIGDAIVVVFGAPTDQQDIEWNAVAAALAIRERLQHLNLRRRQTGRVAIEAGIGVATGGAVSGQIGSMERFLYTVIGDTVNVAARLEALMKKYPDCDLLVNEDTYRAVRDRKEISVDALGPVKVKGRAKAVEVYAVRGVSVPQRHEGACGPRDEEIEQGLVAGVRSALG